MSNMAKKGAAPRVVGRGIVAKRGLKTTLRTVRDAAGKTQVDVAEASGLAQGDVSKLETRADLDGVKIATLRRYVEALGAQIEIVAVFGDTRFPLTGCSAKTKGVT